MLVVHKWPSCYSRDNNFTRLTFFPHHKISDSDFIYGLMVPKIQQNKSECRDEKKNIIKNYYLAHKHTHIHTYDFMSFHLTMCRKKNLSPGVFIYLPRKYELYMVFANILNFCMPDNTSPIPHPQLKIAFS